MGTINLVSSGEEESEENNKPEPEVENVNDEIKDFLSDYKDAPIIEDEAEPEDKPTEATGEPKVKVNKMENATIKGDVIDGMLLLTIVDMVLPTIIVFAHSQLAKGKNGKKAKPIDMRKLKLSKPQLKELSPLVDKISEKIDIEANPIYLLVFSMGAMYFMNYMIATE